MSSSSSPPPFAAQNPSAPGQGPGGALPAAFSNSQISLAPPPPGAPRGLTQQPALAAAFSARPSEIRAPAPAPPAAGPFPGSLPAPPLPFVRAPTASAAQPGPPFGGPHEAAVSQPRPFGGPPGAVSQPPPPFGGPPGAVSQLPRPFGGLPAAVYQAYPPLGGPAGAVSQAPRFVAPPGAVSQPPPFGGPPAVGSQPAPPLFGGPRPKISGPPSATGVASSQAMLPSFGAEQQPAPPFGGPPQFGGPRPGAQPPFAAQSAPGSQQPPFMEMPRANAPVFGPPSWQSEGAGSGAMQPPMRMPGMLGGMPPNTLGQGVPPSTTPTIRYSAHTGTQISTPSKIDPNQIPRPMAETSVIIFETRQGGEATVPPCC